MRGTPRVPHRTSKDLSIKMRISLIAFSSIVTCVFLLGAVHCAVPCLKYGNMRFEGGNSTTNYGVIEICINGECGAICDDGWEEEASVFACKCLGFTTGEKVDECASDVQRNFSINDVNCTEGDLKTLIQNKSCTYTHDVFDCIPQEAVILKCSGEITSTITPSPTTLLPTPTLSTTVTLTPSPSPMCTTGDIRLVDGDTNSSEILQACCDGEYGGVCRRGWNTENSKVACRQLGHFPFGAIYDSQKFEEKFCLGKYDCVGNETSLIDCVQKTEDNCGSRVVALDCLGKDEHNISLVEEKYKGQGIIELKIRSDVGLICGNFWTNEEAKVTCRQLGHSPDNARTLLKQVDGGTFLLDSVYCKGDEEYLLNCLFLKDQPCHSEIAAGVICEEKQMEKRDVSVDRVKRQEPKHCEDGDTRLVRNKNYTWSDGEGLVQICFSNEWRYLCDDQWNNISAMVFCESHNISTPNSRVTKNQYYLNEPFIHYWLDEVVCNGTEETLMECNHTNPGTHDCGPNERAGVICNETSANIISENLVPVAHQRILGRYSHHYIKEHLFAKQANSTITGDNGRINGIILIHRVGDYYKVTIEVTGLDASVVYEWGVSDREYDAFGGTECPTSIFDPENNMDMSCNYMKDCKKDKNMCAAGDYSGRFGLLNRTNVVKGIEDRLNLEQLIGKYMFVKPMKSDGEAKSACGIIIPVYECEGGDVVMTIVANDDFAGPIELCIHGVWHRVCDANWTRQDAKVACRQLELEYDDVQAVYFNDVEVVINRVQQRDVSESCNCFGDEFDLHDCLGTNLTRIGGNNEKLAGALCQS